MARIETLRAVAAGLKRYKAGVREGREDIKKQAYDEVMQGVAALKETTGIEKTREEMRIAGAEETRRAALHPSALSQQETRASEMEAEATRKAQLHGPALRQQEATAGLTEEQVKQLKTENEQQKKTIDALQKQLRDAGQEDMTVEALERGEVAEDILERRKIETAKKKAEAGKAKLTKEQLAAEVATRISKEQLAREVPEKIVAAELEEAKTRERRAVYEQQVMNHLQAYEVPEAEAKSKAAMAANAIERVDAEIKLANANAALATKKSEQLGYQIKGDDLIRKVFAERGLDYDDFLVDKAQIAAGVLPDVNEAMTDLRVAKAAYARILTQPAGRIDPLDIAMAEAMPGVKDMIMALLPSPMDKAAALKILEQHINAQKALLIELGLDYDALAESTLQYSGADFDKAISMFGTRFRPQGVLSGGQVADSLETFALRVLNDPQLMRDEVLEAIHSNRTAGSELDGIFGQENMDAFYELMERMQGLGRGFEVEEEE